MDCLRRQLLALILMLTCCSSAFAADGFVLRAVRVEGNQRISEDTILSYLPVKVGQRIDSGQTATLIESLYKTGFFTDVVLNQQNNSTLVVVVTERPTIGAIRILGNKEVATSKLEEALKEAGIVEGRVYDEASTEALKKALLQQYNNQSRYKASVIIETEPQMYNQVDLLIKIHEGTVAKIRSIRIIGNQAFKESELLGNFTLTPSGILTILTKNDHYSREKLAVDLEKLRSFYRDRGYLNFTIDSSQASITPDQRGIYLVVRITEGPQYQVSGTELKGDLLGHEQRVRELITIKPGDVFSRKEIVEINNRIVQYYAEQGYAFTDVRADPQVKGKANVVLLFDITTGQRVYVRRITVAGNHKTHSDVVRREIIQQEGSAYNLSDIEESKRRLNNLGYLEKIQVTNQKVAGEPHQVDLTYAVEEIPSAKASFDLGYSLTYGLIYGISLTQDNFLGTGNRVGFGFNRSGYSQAYNFSYYNPYYTPSGISRGFQLYVRDMSPDTSGLTNYSANAYGVALTYGFPITEYDRISVGGNFEHLQLSLLNFAPTQAIDFVNANGTNFNQFRLNLAWTRSTLDKLPYPTSGTKQQLSLGISAPIFNDSLDYYKITYDFGGFYPLSEQREYILNARVELGYGGSYAQTVGGLPFFKHFYAGGFGTVRGFKGNSLGPVDSNGDAFGGNVLATGTLALIFPNPISERLRTAVYLDAGNVFLDTIDFSQFRYSVGLNIDWWSPLGPLQFTLAKALNPQSGDDERIFDFSIGTSF